MQHRHTERGNALIYVFVGVALFGALMFLYSRGSSQSSSGFTKQQSVLKAQALIDYSNVVANAVNKMLANGVSENDLSFATDFYKLQNGSVLNPSSKFPNCADERCKVFDVKGGKAKAEALPSLGAMPNNAPSFFPHPGHLIPHVVNIVDVGTSLPELVITFHTVPLEVCKEINILLNNQFGDNPPVGNNTQYSDDYSGPIPTSVTTLGDSNDDWAKGKTAYCYQMMNISNPNMYAYQKTVIVR